MQLIVLAGLGFGGYKLYKWSKANNVKIPGKGILIGLGAILMILFKHSNGAQVRSYQCKKCGKKASINPLGPNINAYDKTSCTAGGSHSWRQIS